jgi:hypothetical protein
MAPIRRRLLLALPTAVVAAAFFGPSALAAAPAPTIPSPTVQPAPATSQGIIMRDGGVCDPIRHMGC